MIRRVEYIKDFGIFRNFSGGSGSGLSDFNQCNLIYGWNYSGKTTLSRVFSSIEQGRVDPSNPSAKFRLSLDNGSSIESGSLAGAPAVAVFNRDFIDSNFSSGHTAPAVFILGKENAALKARRSCLDSRHLRVSDYHAAATKRSAEIRSTIESLGTDKAREVGRVLGERNFNRTHLNKRVDVIRADPSKHRLSGQETQSRLSIVRSGEEFSRLDPIEIAPADFESIKSCVGSVLEQTASRLAINELAEDLEAEEWVRKGLDLHDGSDKCTFCGAPFRESRLEELRGHFSDAYEALLVNIQGEIDSLNKYEMNWVLPNEKLLIPELRGAYQETCAKIDDWAEWAKQARTSIIDLLNQKRTAIETEVDLKVDLSRASDISVHLVSLDSLVERHNDAVENLETSISKAKEELEFHFAAEYFLDNNIRNSEAETARLIDRCKRAQDVEERISNRIQEIDNQISKSSVAAEHLNRLLKYLLDGCNIEVKSAGESEFQFLRDGAPATNLSDGERTAVTLSYFLIGLAREGASLEDTIVFVDDPISSLDSNHVYAVFALICERLGQCRQLFVSTHNSEFFNLLKGQWLGSKGGNNKNASAYWIHRETLPGGTSQAGISDLPPLLRRFKSEYEFLFSILLRFSNSSSPSDDEAYSAPNHLRKFLESYLGFRKPAIRKWHEKLDLLLDSEEARREVQKFCDDASHLHSMNRALQHPDFVASAQRLVTSVLDALQTSDPVHYDSLTDVVGRYPNV